MKTFPVHAFRFDGGLPSEVDDALAVEAALQIKINDAAWTTTMRTPGDDEDLVRGLLFTEGIITERDAPIRIDPIMDPETGIVGCMELTVDPAWIAKPFENRRAIMATSSCGFCGTREPRDLEIKGSPLRIRSDERYDITRAPAMFAAMRERQRTFSESGGSHAAAAFTVEGELLALHEDVGRHNAVDKIAGRLLTEGKLGRARCLIVSGRISYEIVFKAFQARLAFILAVSAPSSLAVEMGERFGMTIVGFCRESRATVYSNPENIVQYSGQPAGV